jgi:group I intron endonuclease
MGGIYFILCLANGKMYVGSAKNLRTRWGDHKKQLNLQRHCNRHLQHAWLKYGECCFTYNIHEVLGKYDKKFFFERENFWMDTFRAEGKCLFNIARAAGGWGEETKLRTNEIAEKIKATLKNRLSAMSEEERKEKFGHLRGKPLSEDRKMKLSEYWKNKPKSEETKMKMSLAQKSTGLERKKQKAEIMAKVGKQRRGKSPSNAKPIFFRGQQYSSAPACKRETGLSMHQILQEDAPERCYVFSVAYEWLLS